MRRNNLFRIIIIAIVLTWSLYQLYPTYNLWQQKKVADSYYTELQAYSGLQPVDITESLNQGLLETHLREAIANGDSLKQAIATANKLIALHEKITANQEKSIKQGLDLLGGTYLVYEVDLGQLLNDLCKNKDSKFDSLLAKVEARTRTSGDDFFVVLQNTFQNNGVRLNRYFGSRTQNDAEVIAEIKKQAQDAVDRTQEVLRNRIDQFGVSEPSITKQGSRRIVIELAGIQNVDRAKNLIGKTALLEFKLLKDPDVFTTVLRDIDRVVAQETKNQTLPSALNDTTLAAVAKPRTDTEVNVSNIFGESTTIGDTTANQDSTVLVDQELFKANPFISLLARIGNDAAVPAKNLRTVQRILNSPDILKVIPSDAEFLFSTKPEPLNEQEYYLMYLVKKEPELTGKYIADARVTISGGDQTFTQGQPEVALSLDREGGRIFARVTGANVGKRLAIILDNKVASAPNLKEKIPSGNARIEGTFTMEEAKELAIVLRAGSLPAPVEVIEERTVGPSLGQDSVRQGQQSMVLGISLVILFMIVYYRLSGFIADFALILNLVILLAALAFFHATLTLPGVAGIILTIGMAVDANVLIFERIREELRTGKTIRAAIDAGYSKAFWTIFDSNVTTFLTALVLYQFGTGPVRGFAVTLSIGIIASMFTAIVVTRVIFDYFSQKKGLKKLSI